MRKVELFQPFFTLTLNLGQCEQRLKIPKLKTLFSTLGQIKTLVWSLYLMIVSSQVDLSQSSATG
jgi:hypothetical protein